MVGAVAVTDGDGDGEDDDDDEVVGSEVAMALMLLGNQVKYKELFPLLVLYFILREHSIVCLFVCLFRCLLPSILPQGMNV